MDMVVRSFIQGGEARLEPEGTVELSRIFQWYALDFGGRLVAVGSRGSLVRYAAPFTGAPKLWAASARRPGRRRFQPYDRSLNKRV